MAQAIPVIMGYIAASLPYLAAAVVSTALSLAISALMAPNIKGPRQQDRGIQSSEYGRPIFVSYGPQNRFAGAVIWYSGLIEQENEQSGSGGSNTSFSYSCSAAILLSEGREHKSIKRIWANKKIIYNSKEPEFDEGNEVSHVYESVRFYPGSATQMPDPTMEAALGAGNVPGYRHCCYVVITGLQLADFGPMLPNLEFELESDESITVVEVVADIAARAGVTINTDDIVDNTGLLGGFTITEEMSAADALAPLCAAYFFDVAEQGGALRCVPRGMKSRVTIPMGDTGAVAAGSPSQQTIDFEQAPDTDVPQEVAVSYIDFDNDMQIGTVRSRYELGSHRANLNFTLLLTMTPGHAQAVADRALRASRFGSVKGSLSVSERWLRVVPANIVSFETSLGLLPFQVGKATRGADGVINWEVAYDDQEAYPKVVYAPSGTLPTDAVGAPGPTVLQLIDCPILRDADDDAGYYWLVSGTKAAWRGATVIRSTDGGTDYTDLKGAVSAGTIGTVATAVAAGGTNTWDRRTVITVVLSDLSKTLSGISELSVLNGGNSCWIGNANGVGGEILQFATATLIAPGTYELTDLLRGRRGTEWAVGKHEDGEMFVLIADAANISRSNYGPSDWNSERLFKPISIGTSGADVAAQPFTNGGEGKRCFSPVHLVGRRSAAQDIAVSWFRRSRMFGGGLASVTPLGEKDETYDLDFYEPADAWAVGESYLENDIRREQAANNYEWRWYRARVDHVSTLDDRPNNVGEGWKSKWQKVSPLRSVSISEDTTYRYAAVDQTDDGITPGDPVQIQCRQKSSAHGFGHPALSLA